MSIDSIKAPAGVMQSTQSLTELTPIVSQGAMGIKIIGLIGTLLIIIGIIAGIIYMIKSKKTKGKRIFIGAIIIIVPLIINWILNIVKVNMLLNM